MAAEPTGRPKYYGFVMVTVDPERVDGNTGSALKLVRERLENGLWPLFTRTSNRRVIDEGSRLCFYVGGAREKSGDIVATATVGKREEWAGRRPVDPEEYFTDYPATVLHLTAVQWLAQPIRLRDELENLTICPKNLGKWGVVLHGGSRGLSERDWKVLFADEKS